MPRDASIHLSADGVALSLAPVKNPIPRGTFGSINRFYRVSSDRPFSRAPILVPYDAHETRFVDDATLRLFRWDEERRSLVLVPESGVNVRERYVWGRIPAPGVYGLIGLPRDENVLRTIAMLAALDPADVRGNKAFLPKVCGLILCARDGPPGGGLPGGGNLCDFCLGLEIPQLGLPEGQLIEIPIHKRPVEPAPPAPTGAPWPMYGHDPRHTGRSGYPGPATQPSIRWTFTPSLTTWPQFSSAQLSHPVVDINGTVYVGASGLSFSGAPEIGIYALDGATGSRKWSQGWVAPATVVLTTPQPAVGGDGTIYAVIGNMVFAFKPDGNVKWVWSHWNVVPQNPLPAPDGTVYVFNWRWVTGATSQNGLFALDATGNSKWSAPFDTGMSGFLPMTVRDDGSVIVTGSHVWALAPDKTVRWKHTLSGVTAEASPAVADDGTIYVGVRPTSLTTAELRALDANGNAKAGWVAPPWGLETPALADSGAVYLGFQSAGSSWGGAKLDARNPDGSLKWSRSIPGEVPNAPAIGRDGTIYLASGYRPSSGSTGATVYALDPATGLDRWTFGLGPLTWSNTSPAIGLDKTLYVAEASKGTLYALK